MSAAKPHGAWPRFEALPLTGEPPHPNALLAEHAKGICLLARLWAQSNDAPPGVRPSSR